MDNLLEVVSHFATRGTVDAVKPLGNIVKRDDFPRLLRP